MPGTGTEAALQDQTVPHARIRGEVEPLPVVALVAVVALERAVVARRADGAEPVALQEREPLSRAGQRFTRRRRRGDRELVEVRRPERLVVGDVEVAPPP